MEAKQERQVLDYDDLLLYWYHLMEEPSLAAGVRERFDHVLVDEYQDTNALQAGILARLRPAGEGLTVVGDDAQAIYSFRGTTVENILGFAGEVVELEENYRSTQAILDAANALARKRLRAARPGGAKPRYVSVADDQEQAAYAVAGVLAAREAGIALRRQAVLFRSSHHSDFLELELLRRNIPYVKYGGLKFLEAAHVKDLLAVLRWADNPKNKLAAFRALQLVPGVGPARAERSFAQLEAGNWEAVREHDPALAALLCWLMDPGTPWPGQLARVREWYAPELERRYEQAEVRMGDLEQLERIATSFATREEFLSELALDPPAASGDLAGEPHLDEDYLVLSTVHSAKGQEWEAVHILNVSDGNFPNEFSTGKPELIEEERRLLYVAMTRAKADLHLIAPLRYYVTGQSRTGDRHVYGAKSRFLTKAVMACLDEVAFGESQEGPPGAQARANVDVAGALRAMWS